MKNWKYKMPKGFTGFTFAEVLITLSLFLILASLGVGSYFRYYSLSLINNDMNKIQGILHSTRFKAMKNPYKSDYGIHLNETTGELTTFRDTYTANNPENITVTLDQLSITDINLENQGQGSNQILFENISGKTQNNGSFTVSNPDLSYDFTINKLGVFE